MARPNYAGAQAFVPPRRTLPVLQAAVQRCRGCDLYRGATQAVFGEGAVTARVMLVGEVPGDREDQLGHVFVGPAGRLLDDAIAAAGLAREDVYLTNAVKHFKFTRRGKRRIHDRPTRYETVACRPWLEAELALVRPAVLVLLGALASQSLLGPKFRVTQDRGKELVDVTTAHVTIATLHPAAVLRAPTPEARADARAKLFADLAKAAALAAPATGHHRARAAAAPSRP